MRRSGCLALGFFVGFSLQCHGRPNMPSMLDDPTFRVRQIQENFFSVVAPDIRTFIERLNCGEELQCTVQHAGEVIIMRAGSTDFAVQIPLKTDEQLLEDVGCGERFICALGAKGMVTILHRKKP